MRPNPNCGCELLPRLKIEALSHDKRGLRLRYMECGYIYAKEMGFVHSYLGVIVGALGADFSIRDVFSGRRFLLRPTPPEEIVSHFTFKLPYLKP